jgi:hypothetical protein
MKAEGPCTKPEANPYIRLESIGPQSSCSSRHYQPGHAPNLAFPVHLANNDFLGFNPGFTRDVHEQVTCR